MLDCERETYYISLNREMTNTNLSSAVELARALAHPSRLRVLAMLETGELCVCQITEILEAAPSTVSAHLRELRRAGLICERKDGRWVYVALSVEGPARPWIHDALESVRGDEQIALDAARISELRLISAEELCRYGLAGALARADTRTDSRTDF